MTATLPPMIRFQPLVAGACLPGGKVYFYQAGTLTPQAAYAADGTTPLSNPLTLDANGAGMTQPQRMVPVSAGQLPMRGLNSLQD